MTILIYKPALKLKENKHWFLVIILVILGPER